jgi:hypothetical protein
MLESIYSRTAVTLFFTTLALPTTIFSTPVEGSSVELALTSPTTLKQHSLVKFIVLNFMPLSKLVWHGSVQKTAAVLSNRLAPTAEEKIGTAPRSGEDEGID